MAQYYSSFGEAAGHAMEFNARMAAQHAVERAKELEASEEAEEGK